MAKKMFRKKKATIGDTIVDTYSYIMLAFMLSLFFVFLRISAGQARGVVNINAKELNTNSVLLNYLKTPTTYLDTERTMDDLIIKNEENIMNLKKDGKRLICSDYYPSYDRYLELNSCKHLISETKDILERHDKQTFVAASYDYEQRMVDLSKGQTIIPQRTDYYTPESGAEEEYWTEQEKLKQNIQKIGFDKPQMNPEVLDIVINLPKDTGTDMSKFSCNEISVPMHNLEKFKEETIVWVCQKNKNEK